MSRFHFHRIFKLHAGVTPKAYAAARRAARVRAALGASGSVTDAIYAAGFNSSALLCRQPAMLGMTPTRFKARRQRGGDPLRRGRLFAGRDPGGRDRTRHLRGLDGRRSGTLVRDLQDRFPKAELVGADAGFERTVALVVGLVEAPRIGLDLPLDLRGTAFQQRVWAALRAIPAGETVSYTELAQRIGSPAAVRAVAGACAANPVAVAIPCHRVVRNDGGLSGYRWGIERKAALIQREKT
jgi:AraC family transcriptional regulator of adaptative response/methylated-DNA-[protein]-cysteine methyltransferase